MLVYKETKSNENKPLHSTHFRLPYGERGRIDQVAEGNFMEQSGGILIADVVWQGEKLYLVYVCLFAIKSCSETVWTDFNIALILILQMALRAEVYVLLVEIQSWSPALHENFQVWSMTWSSLGVSWEQNKSYFQRIYE